MEDKAISKAILLACIATFVSSLFLSNKALADSSNASDCSENPCTDDVLKVRLLSPPDRFPKETVHWQMVELALQKSEQAYDFDVSAHIRAPRREIAQLKEHGDEANLVWSATGSPTEDELLPIRIPIFGGLLSYWHVWVREADIEKFLEIQTIDDLTNFSLLQGHGWKVIKIFEAEGFDVRTGDTLSLPKMLAQQRADMFIYPVLQSASFIRYGAKEAGLVPLPNLIIHLPLDHYNYVSRENSTELYDALMIGMHRAFEDGSYENLIRMHPMLRDSYDLLARSEYSLLKINNPNLSEETLDALNTYGLNLNLSAETDFSTKSGQ